jgi:hypothetical protein
MSQQKVMYACEVCGGTFQFGPHVYDGRYIPTYRLRVCSGCYQGNWDGWAPQFEDAVTQHLLAAGAQLPTRNSKGLLPRD